MSSNVRYEIRNAETGQVITGNSLPTPRLLAEGGGEAYPTGALGAKGQPMWRLRDDTYDPPGTRYRNVTIHRIEEYA